MVYMEPPTTATGGEYAALVASEIRACMARAGVTQGELAEAIGLSRQSLASRLHGKTAFDVVDLCRVAAHFGLSVSELLGRAEAAA